MPMRHGRDLASIKHGGWPDLAGANGSGPAPLGILVITHNSLGHLREFLAGQVAVAEALDVPFLVIDNASDDHTVGFLREIARQRPTVVTQVNSTNRGYAVAVNQGFTLLPGHDILLINPDVQLSEPRDLGTLARALADNPRAAVVAPRLLNLDGSPQASARRFPSLLAMAGHSSIAIRFGPTQRVTQGYLELPPEGEPTNVDWVIGAAMMIRREAYEAVGGFDERYFVYLEDTDFCLRCAEAGWETVYFPDVALRHVHSRASSHALGGVVSSRARRHHVISMLRFFARYPHLIRSRH